MICAVIAAVIFTAVTLHQAYYVGRFAPLAEGKLYRSRQPFGWHWSVLKRHDIKMVINLRSEGEFRDYADLVEEIERCKEYGAEYINIPVTTALPSYADVETFLKSVRRSKGAALFHCEHGRTRAGFMAGAYRIVMDDWTVDQALDEMVEFGYSFRKKRELTMTMLNTFRRDRQAWLDKTAPAPEPAPVTN